MANHFYVYELSDPRDGQVFYVGKGCGKRVQRHARDVTNGKVTNAAKYRRIKAIHDAGLSVVETVITGGLSERDAFRLERRLIAEKKRQLTNVSRGTSSPDDILLEHSRIGIQRCEWTIRCHENGYQFPEGWIDATREWLGTLRRNVDRLSV